VAVLDQDALYRTSARGAGMWFIVFIASMISTVWPSVTVRANRDKGRGAGFGGKIGRANHRRGHGAGMLRRVFMRNSGRRCRGRRRLNGRMMLNGAGAAAITTSPA
jgi:hypothetical protein